MNSREIIESRFTKQTLADYESLPYDSGERYTDRPRGIGPHVGRDLTLMLAGMKPLTMQTRSGVRKFLPYLQSGKLVYAGKTMGFGNVVLYFIALPGQEWRGRQATKMMRQLHLTQDPDKEAEIHKRMGLLLGYPKEAIRAFLSRSYNKE